MPDTQAIQDIAREWYRLGYWPGEGDTRIRLRRRRDTLVATSFLSWRAYLEETSTRPVGRCLTSVYLQYWRASSGTHLRHGRPFARPRRAVKPQRRIAARRRRGA